MIEELKKIESEPLAVDGDYPLILSAGDAVDVYTSNLDKVWVDSTVNGDGVTFVYYTG